MQLDSWYLAPVFGECYSARINTVICNLIWSTDLPLIRNSLLLLRIIICQVWSISRRVYFCLKSIFQVYKCGHRHYAPRMFSLNTIVQFWKCVTIDLSCDQVNSVIWVAIVSSIKYTFSVQTDVLLYAILIKSKCILIIHAGDSYCTVTEKGPYTGTLWLSSTLE